MSDSAAEQLPAGNRTRAESVAAIERASGRSWEAWVALFEAQQAKALPHAEIAKIARAALPDSLANPDWWAQGTAIAYEQHAGLRVPGQGSDGFFRVSASRTLPIDRDAAIDAWVAAYGAAAEHRGVVVLKPRRSRTDKRSFWRFDLDGAGRVEVAATPKDDTRITFAVNHDGMTSGEEIEQWRAHWKALIAAL